MGKKSKQDKKRTPVPVEIERQVYVEAGFRCSVPRCPNNTPLETHHIDYDPSNNDPANLLVLCSNCHGRATRREIDRKACLMIKQQLSLQGLGREDLLEVRDNIIAEIRNAVPSQDEAKPLLEKDRGTQRPNGRIEAAASQVMTFNEASIPLPTEILRSIAYSLYTSGELHAALEIQRIVMKSGTPIATDHYNLGLLLYKTDRKEAAEEAYRKALDADPENADAWSDLGVVLYETDRKEPAEEAYHKALGVAPENARVWFNLGILLKHSGRVEEAEQAYHKAIDSDPKFAEAWSNLGVLLSETDRKETAEEAYRKAIEIDPQRATPWTNLGRLLEATGRREEAAEAGRKAMEAGAHNAGEHNSLAYLLWECGRFEDAELEVMEALKDDPNHVYAHATLGLLRLEQNDLDAGRQGYEKAIGFVPDNKDLQQKYHYEYGRALARNERPEEARKELEVARGVDATYVPREQIEAELAKLLLSPPVKTDGC